MDKFSNDRIKVGFAIALICFVFAGLITVTSLVGYKVYSIVGAHSSIDWIEIQCKIAQAVESEEVIARFLLPSKLGLNLGIPIHGTEAKVSFSYELDGKPFYSELITPPNRFFRHSSERWLKTLSPGETRPCFVDKMNPSLAVLFPHHQFEDLNYWEVGNLAFVILLVGASLYIFIALISRRTSRKS